MNPRIILQVGFFLLLMCGVGALYAWRQFTPREAGHADDYRPGEAIAAADLTIPEFTLTGTDGQTFDSKSLDGEIRVLSFFYTTCPGPCLELNNRLRQLNQKYADAEGLNFLSITANPVIDTPEALADYAQQYGADPDRWRFLTGSPDVISKIASSLLVGVDVNGEDNNGSVTHPVTHTDRLVVVDRSGKVVGAYQSLDPVQLQLCERKLDALLQGTD
jgi:cytochrome oxidase Cu insertion factor (SCO1/SenC/PrrC family)